MLVKDSIKLKEENNKLCDTRRSLNNTCGPVVRSAKSIDDTLTNSNKLGSHISKKPENSFNAQNDNRNTEKLDRKEVPEETLRKILKVDDK